jgi:hypothetical protein
MSVSFHLSLFHWLPCVRYSLYDKCKVKSMHSFNQREHNRTCVHKTQLQVSPVYFYLEYIEYWSKSLNSPTSLASALSGSKPFSWINNGVCHTMWHHIPDSDLNMVVALYLFVALMSPPVLLLLDKTKFLVMIFMVTCHLLHMLLTNITHSKCCVLDRATPDHAVQCYHHAEDRGSYQIGT